MVVQLVVHLLRSVLCNAQPKIIFEPIYHSKNC